MQETRVKSANEGSNTGVQDTGSSDSSQGGRGKLKEKDTTAGGEDRFPKLRDRDPIH